MLVEALSTSCTGSVIRLVPGSLVKALKKGVAVNKYYTQVVFCLFTFSLFYFNAIWVAQREH